MTFLVCCIVMGILLLSASDFGWYIYLFTGIDLVAMIFIGLQEINAIYSFMQKRQLKGRAREISNMILRFALPAILIHVFCAILISSTTVKDEYKDYREYIIIYIVTAFGYDFYHYLMGLIFYINLLLVNIGPIIEEIIRCKIFNHCRVYQATSREYKIEIIEEEDRKSVV